MEQLLNGKSCAPACPIQLPEGGAENSGRLVALMAKRGEGKCQADGGRRQAAAERSLEIHRQHKDGKNWEQTIFSPFTAPCPRMSTAEPPVFPTPLGPGGLGGLDGYSGV